MGVRVSVGIVGVGHVGAHVANGLVQGGVADELCLVDIDSAKVAAETQDLRDSLFFAPHSVDVVNCGTDYAELAHCDVIVNAVGNIELAAVTRDGELTFTTDATRSFVTTIEEAGFEGVWVTISNPCDVVATEIWHLTGHDPRRVIGTGTALDSARLRHVLSDVTGFDQHSISAYMLGEHGASQFACWSHVAFGGKPLSEWAEEDPDSFRWDLDALEDAARQGGYVTMGGKHCTEYAVAEAACSLVRAVVSDTHTITACSALLTGEYGEQGIYLSLPCVVGARGVERVICLDLSDSELAALHHSADRIRANIAQLDWW